jgi:hypothetical protein
MKDDHKDFINHSTHDMAKAIKENKDKMAEIQRNPNPSMADIDAMLAVFGNYEQLKSNNSED